MGFSGRELGLHRLIVKIEISDVFLTRQMDTPSDRENTGLDNGPKILTFKA